MPGTKEMAAQSGRKRKHEEDDTLPVKSKRSRSERRSDKRTKDHQGPQEPTSHKAPDGNLKPTKKARSEEKGESAVEEAVKQTAQDAAANVEPKLTKGQRRKQRNKAKNAARQNGTISIGNDKVDTRIQNEPDDERTVDNKKPKKKRPKSLQGDHSAQSIEQTPTNGIAKVPHHSWILSPSSAGRLLDHDPIFVQDEDGQDYLITANDREIQLLSLESSLMVRTLPPASGSSVLCYATENASATNVHIAYSDGTFGSWDWMSGISTTHKHRARGVVKAMAVVQTESNTKPNVYYITNLEGRTAICRLGKTLRETKYSLSSLQVLGGAESLVAQGPSVLVLGMRKHEKETTDDYIWIEIPMQTGSACFDARLMPVQASSKKDRKQSGVRLAIGHADGQIHLYDDVSSVFAHHEKATLQSPCILHWHREAVSSVKFSQDGNYLISGGKETVLVIWQLETGTKQYLPHLTSEIERIVVNPVGDRYALQMGDNSIMVLNTAELKPVANFAGLQMLTRTKKDENIVSTAPVATLNPRHPYQLILTVPSTQPKAASDIWSRPFLQTFDTRASRHITRQALTRNNVTDLNLGPEKTPIIPPDVKHVAVSYDGSWLATIDEWMPPASDLSHLASDNVSLEAERHSRREVYLKFWSWDETQTLWTLTTRVDSPHSRFTADRMGSGCVLTLATDPANNGFATIGEDNRVKFWKPKSRIRHGVALKDKSDVDLVEWNCKRTVQLVSDKERADSPMDTMSASKPMKACLAYSADGSMLAAAQPTLDVAEPPLVHFMNTITGDLISKSGLAKNQITALGFLDRYFIELTCPAVYVWDLVNDALMYKLKLRGSNAAGEEKKPQLCINDGDGTFAIVFQAKSANDTRIEVHSARETTCLYKQEFKMPVEAVLAGKGVRGYTLLFADATIRTISPAGASNPRLLQSAAVDSAISRLSNEPPQIAAEPSGEAADVEMDDMLGSTMDTADRQGMVIEEGDDRPVVRPEQLARVFDTAQSFAMPPVKDMFEAVIDLFGQKPHVKSQTEIAR